eukprot:6420697-Amphidinium_carterae.2
MSCSSTVLWVQQNIVGRHLLYQTGESVEQAMASTVEVWCSARCTRLGWLGSDVRYPCKGPDSPERMGLAMGLGAMDSANVRADLQLVIAGCGRFPAVLGVNGHSVETRLQEPYFHSAACAGTTDPSPGMSRVIGRAYKRGDSTVLV